ncbi:butyrophilin subfamily 2 member A2-like isoform X3 [Phascolarctos cinereus]|uniref:Butyrophilin subfamily 2 member A2-like isoform X3 n=1 Tax=Phascolarctos cinereus TaxID=38626 RepID=A0A6P5IKE6_PHACI|nr:butyrophilin subfamily 2 member A2-like isoform X3 [Phascolarctos cinereus]
MNMAYFPDHSVLSGLVAVLFLQLIMRISAHFTVVAHAEPPLTMIGEDATLRCHLFPKKSAEQMEVRWFRSQFSPAVYVYKDGKERDEEQMEEYRGRTTFVRDNIRDGNVALKIHNVTAFENGRYHCYFQEGRSYEEAFMDLKVTSYEYGWIQLECTSAGWYPQPWVEWRNLVEETIPSLEESLAPSEDGLFVVTLSVIITDPTVVSVFCSIQNLLLSQELLTMMSIPETVWVSTSMPSESPSEFLDPTTPVPEKVSTWMIILTVALPALGLFIAFSIYFMWKQHKRKKTLFIEKEIECEEKEREFDKKGQEHTGKERECNLTGWRRTQLHAADVTLDRNTAHPELYLSSDLRSVMRGDTRQDLPDNPERFDCRPCVLGRESFTSGRHYWEVEVADVMVWALGVCSENSERKGEALLIPQNGFWVIELFGGRYQALTSPDILLPLPEHLDRVGIFLDYEAGDVSFYNMIDRSHIYTCPRTSFSGPIRPFFRLGSDDNPLVICPAFTGAEGVTVPKSGLILYRKLH